VENRDAVEAFHRIFYESDVWWRTFWLGTGVLKNPLDLWVYQEIIYELRPDLIVECGTYAGGSAQYFATICDLIGHGRVLTIDSEPRERRKHKRIRYVLGSTTAPDTIERVRREASSKKTVMVVLDSDHSRDHVLEELRLYSPLVTPGSYLVVEDTNVNGHPVRPDHGPGPMEAVEAFLAENGRFEVDESREKFLLTFYPRGWLKRVR